MKQMRLIEPNWLAGLRMIRHGLTNLRGAQNVLILPLELNVCCAAVGLDLRPITCLKNILPGKIERLTVISHVHDALVDEGLSNGRRDPVSYTHLRAHETPE